MKINGKNMEKIIAVTGMALSLMACDALKPRSEAQNICEAIALERLKHPGSFDRLSASEKTGDQNKIEIQINFEAWNDFKVPLPHSILCRFQDNILESVKWNGRPLRAHELDRIREEIHGSGI